MENSRSVDSLRTTRQIKVKRRLMPAQSIERKFRSIKTVKIIRKGESQISDKLQKEKHIDKWIRYEQNPQSFLKSTKVSPMRLSIEKALIKTQDDGQIQRHHVVGPLSLFKPKKQTSETETITPCSVRYSNKPFNFKRQRGQNHLAEYRKRLEEINKGSLLEQQKQLELLDRMILSDALEHSRQQKTMKNYQSMEKFWDKMQNNISQKLNRPKENLAVSRSEFFRQRVEDYNVAESKKTPDERMGNNAWYMSLRQSNQSKNQKSAFFSVGSQLSGLQCYMKQRDYKQDMQIKRPGSLQSSLRSYRSDPYFKNLKTNKKANIDFDNLYITGYNKLPMEQESLHNVGIQHFDPNLIVKGDLIDEIIAENYDKVRVNTKTNQLTRAGSVPLIKSHK